MPKDAIADRGDQDPSSLRATTNPVPTLYVTIKPTFATVKIARPLACFRIAPGMDFSGVKHPICDIDSVNSQPHENFTRLMISCTGFPQYPSTLVIM